MVITYGPYKYVVFQQTELGLKKEMYLTYWKVKILLTSIKLNFWIKIILYSYHEAAILTPVQWSIKIFTAHPTFG